MERPIDQIRREYASAPLDERDLDPNPIRQFDRWFREALAVVGDDATAMSLATVDRAGHPAVRMVLLKGFDERGFVFYTNYQSPKAADLDRGGQAALCFWWPRLERQVRIAGGVTRVEASESDAYFATRPRDSQLGAHASVQSAVVPSRAQLEAAVAAAMVRFGSSAIPRPEHWGGYRVAPRTVEFWQGRIHRLHDRLLYVRDADAWSIRRLSP